MPKDPGFYIALAIGVGLIAWVVRWILRQKKAHRQALEAIGQELGLQYHRDGEGLVKTSHPVFSWFRKGHGYNLDHVLDGEHQGYRAQFFEVANRDNDNRWRHTVFSLQKEGAEFGEFTIEPHYKDHSKDASFDTVFTCKNGAEDFAKISSEEFKSNWVQIRAANEKKSGMFRTSPYAIRVSGDRIVCNWPLMPFAKDASWFHECLKETVFYANTLSENK